MKPKLSKIDTVSQSITHYALDKFQEHDMDPQTAVTILGGIRLFIIKRIFDVDWEEAKKMLKEIDDAES